jgi:hypothetical protein
MLFTSNSLSRRCASTAIAEISLQISVSIAIGQEAVVSVVSDIYCMLA